MSELCVSHVLQCEADKATGMITASLGDVLSGEGVDNAATVFQQWGFLSIPAPPIPGVSAPEAVYIETGDVNIVISGRSVRTGAVAGLLKAGESCVFADGSQACMLFKSDGSCVQYTTHTNTPEGRAVYSRTSPDGFEFVSPFGRMRMDSTGFHYSHVSGARIDCGSVSAPALPPQVTSYVSMSGGLVRVNGSVVSVGPDVGVAAPVAKATPLLPVLTAFNAILGALKLIVPVTGSGVCFVGTTVTTGIAPTKVLTVLIETAETAIANCLEALPSQSTGVV